MLSVRTLKVEAAYRFMNVFVAVVYGGLSQLLDEGPFELGSIDLKMVSFISHLVQRAKAAVDR
jgi:hypothetical protein